MRSEILIRRARLDDLQAIVDLLSDDPLGALREAAGPPFDPVYADAFSAIAADPNQFLAVAETDTLLVGVLQLTFIPGLSRKGLWRGQIESVRIHHAYRSQGLGRRLFDWAIETCRQRGCGLVQLTTDASRTDAHRFYESFGFVASHRGFKLELT
jgi:GNAT superfamily N-acetyltransferase